MAAILGWSSSVSLIPRLFSRARARPAQRGGAVPQEGSMEANFCSYTLCLLLACAIHQASLYLSNRPSADVQC
jgi:hypothetical protein